MKLYKVFTNKNKKIKKIIRKKGNNILNPKINLINHLMQIPYPQQSILK